MPIKFTNNASAPLAASINSSSVSITVTASSGALFPSLGAGEYFYATLVNSSNVIEIVKVTARSGDTLTAVRAQEGTTALSWAAADKIELRITAADLANFSQLDAVNAFTGNNTFSGTSTFSGAVALPAAPTFGGGVLGVLYGGTGASTAAAVAAALATEFGKLLFPVGSIYTNATNATNPGTLLGFGTWTAFGAGRVPVGFNAANALFDTAEETGGSADAITVSHTHTFTGTALATHQHSYNDTGAYAGGSGPGDAVVQNQGNNRLTTATSGGTPAGTNSTEGASATNANYQPYITVYMWKRTA